MGIGGRLGVNEQDVNLGFWLSAWPLVEPGDFFQRSCGSEYSEEERRGSWGSLGRY